MVSQTMLKLHVPFYVDCLIFMFLYYQICIKVSIGLTNNIRARLWVQVVEAPC